MVLCSGQICTELVECLEPGPRSLVNSEAKLVPLDSRGLLLLGETDLFDGVGGKRVWGGDEWRFGAVAEFVSHVADLSDGAVVQGEAGEEGNTGTSRKVCF